VRRPCARRRRGREHLGGRWYHSRARLRRRCDPRHVKARSDHCEKSGDQHSRKDQSNQKRHKEAWGTPPDGGSTPPTLDRSTLRGGDRDRFNTLATGHCESRTCHCGYFDKAGASAKSVGEAVFALLARRDGLGSATRVAAVDSGWPGEMRGGVVGKT